MVRRRARRRSQSLAINTRPTTTPVTYTTTQARFSTCVMVFVQSCARFRSCALRRGTRPQNATTARRQILENGMAYYSCYMAPIKKADLPAYRETFHETAAIFKELGALEITEFMAADADPSETPTFLEAFQCAPRRDVDLRLGCLAIERSAGPVQCHATEKPSSHSVAGEFRRCALDRRELPHQRVAGACRRLRGRDFQG